MLPNILLFALKTLPYTHVKNARTLDWKIHAYKRLKQYESFLTSTSPRIAILSMLLEISGNLIFDVNSHANQFSRPFFSILTEDDFIIIWSRNQFCKYLFLIFIIYTFYTTRKYSRCLPCHLREIDWGKQWMFLTLYNVCILLYTIPWKWCIWTVWRGIVPILWIIFSILLKLWFALGLWGYTYLPGLIILSLKVVQGEKLSIDEEVTWKYLLGSWWIVSAVRSQILLYFLIK